MTQTVLQPIVRRELLIDAPLDHVWQLVATERGLRQWWGNPIMLEAQEGGRCQEWRLSGERSTHWQGVVTLYAPPHQLMLTLKAQMPQQGEPELTTIAFSLDAQGAQTRVQVTQRLFGIPMASGIPAASGKESDISIGNQEQIAPPFPIANPHWPPAARLGSNSYPSTTSLEPKSAAPASQSGPIPNAIQQAWNERLTTLATLINALPASFFTTPTFQSKI